MVFGLHVGIQVYMLGAGILSSRVSESHDYQHMIAK
jgi:hypothetical protein